MDIQPSLIANSQPTEPVEPGKSALHYPPMPAQPLAALHSSAGYARNNASFPQCLSAYSEVVCFVRVQLYGSSSASPSAELLFDGLDTIDHLNEHLAVMDVSC